MERGIRRLIDAIEAEMRRSGMWDAPQPETPEGVGAFGGDSMAFEQWLRWVFVPRVRELLESGGPWPASSMVGDKAYREWRMWGDAPNVDRLIELLREFDALFGTTRDG